MAANVTRRVVVADGVLIQRGSTDASDDHVGTTVDGDTPNTGGALPQHLRKVTNVVEDVVRNVRLAEVVQHCVKFALVPALGDTSSDIEVVTRDSEEVLSLSGSRGKVVCEVASLGS